MSRHFLWIPLCALLLALGVRVEAQPSKKILRVGYLAAISATADAPASGGLSARTARARLY